MVYTGIQPENLVGGLDANHGAHEHAQQRHNAQTLDADGVHFFQQHSPEDRPFLWATQHPTHERDVPANVKKQPHGTKVQANFAPMKATAKTFGLLALLVVGIGLVGCSTSQGAAKCPTCPEWSSPAKPAH